MNSTPPMARLITSLVLGAVWPIYCPTRSSRVTATRWPRRTKPRRCRISAMRRATVVLPVPGLPVKDICRVGVPPASSSLVRIRSISSSEAISLIRALTGASPTNSRSSFSSTSPMPALSNSWRRSMAPVSCFNAASPIALTLGQLRRISPCGVAHRPSLDLLAFQEEAALLGRAVDDEGQFHRFPAVRAVEGGNADIAIAERLAASGQLGQDAGGVLEVEHRLAPHLPIGVAGMRIVGEFDVHAITAVEAVLHLGLDLLVGEVGQEGITALGNAHD